jgi:hypothetical protein
MKTACGCRFLRLILTCFLGICFASPIDAGPRPVKQEILVTHQGGVLWATISASTDPAQCRIKKTDRTSGVCELQPDGLSATSCRFNRHLTHLWFFGKTGKNPVASLYSANSHGRAPPSL